MAVLHLLFLFEHVQLTKSHLNSSISEFEFKAHLDVCHRINLCSVANSHKSSWWGRGYIAQLTIRWWSPHFFHFVISLSEFHCIAFKSHTSGSGTAVCHVKTKKGTVFCLVQCKRHNEGFCDTIITGSLYKKNPLLPPVFMCVQLTGSQSCELLTGDTERLLYCPPASLVSSFSLPNLPLAIFNLIPDWLTDPTPTKFLCRTANLVQHLLYPT